MNSTQLSFPLTIECGTCKCCDAHGVKVRYNFGMFWYMCDKCLGINNTSKPKQINPQKIAAALAALAAPEEKDDNNEKICCSCAEKFEDWMNSPMCDDCFENLDDDRDIRM